MAEGFGVGVAACLDCLLGGSLGCLTGVADLLVLRGVVLALTDCDLIAALPRVSTMAALLALASLLDALELVPFDLAKLFQSSTS